MEDLIEGEDFQNIAEGLKETSSLTDRQLQLKRNSGFTGGTMNGQAPSPTYLYFNFMGTVESITQVEAVHSGGMLTLGDLRVTTTLAVNEKVEGEVGGGYSIQQGDVLIYDQKEWFMVGNPKREYVAGGIAFTESFWRRT